MNTFSDNKPSVRTPLDWLRLILSGICMGIADIIPGISGGTIAFIMGFYEDLLNSIKTFNGENFIFLLRGRFREFFQNVAWKFILGLVCGIIIAMVCLAQLIGSILNHEMYRTLLYSAFFGLILAAAFLCGIQLKKWLLSHLIIFCLGGILAFLLTSFSFDLSSNQDLYDVKFDYPISQKSTKNYNAAANKLIDVPKATLSAMLAKGVIHASTHVYSHSSKSYGAASDFVKPIHAKKLDIWIISCGAIAICAMILPGISGSYLLTILGMYSTVIGALADFTTNLARGNFESNSFFILINMLFGIILGALFFTRFISWILNKYHDLAIALLTGFMVGALGSVWPFWSYQYTLLPLKLEKGPQLEVFHPLMPSWMDSTTWLSIALALAGASLVFGLHIIAKRTAKASKNIAGL